MIALQGDKGDAINALRQFANDPLQKSPVAPLAMIALATLLREQNQAQAAADTLKQARDKFEAQLTATRSGRTGCRCSATTTASRSSRPASPRMRGPRSTRRSRRPATSRSRPRRRSRASSVPSTSRRRRSRH